MTRHEFRAALHALELTQGEAAALLGVSLRKVCRYISGEYPVPRGHALLLRRLVLDKLTLSAADYDDLLAEIDTARAAKSYNLGGLDERA